MLLLFAKWHCWRVAASEDKFWHIWVVQPNAGSCCVCSAEAVLPHAAVWKGDTGPKNTPPLRPQSFPPFSPSSSHDLAPSPPPRSWARPWRRAEGVLSNVSGSPMPGTLLQDFEFVSVKHAMFLGVLDSFSASLCFHPGRRPQRASWHTPFPPCRPRSVWCMGTEFVKFAMICCSKKFLKLNPVLQVQTCQLSILWKPVLMENLFPMRCLIILIWEDTDVTCKASLRRGRSTISLATRVETWSSIWLQTSIWFPTNMFWKKGRTIPLSIASSRGIPATSLGLWKPLVLEGLLPSAPAKDW